MTENPRLRYIDARHVESSVKGLEGFEVVTSAGSNLGELDGLIVDPPERRILYFVVHRGGWFGRQQRLVPMCSARLDLDHRSLHVELESDTECPAYEAGAFPPFSDEDLLSAVMRRSVSIH